MPNLYGAGSPGMNNLAQQLMAQRPQGPPAPPGAAGGFNPNTPPGYNQMGPQQQQGPMGPSPNMLAQQLQMMQKPYNPMMQTRPQPTQPPMMGQMRPQMPMPMQRPPNGGIRGPVVSGYGPHGQQGQSPYARQAPPQQMQRPAPQMNQQGQNARQNMMNRMQQMRPQGPQY